MLQNNTNSRGFIRKIFEQLFILALYILLLPLIFIGFLLAMYKEILVSKKLGVSFTMGQVLQIRWILHLFHTRPDEKSYKLIKVIPNESYFGLFMFVAPLYINYKIFGSRPSLAIYPESGKETVLNFVNQRTRFFDESLQNIPAEIKQAILLGAGLDVRAIDATKKGLRAFELDQPGSQQFKIDMLHEAQIFNEQVNYLPVNFTEESWADLLLQSDYKRSQKSWFLWEGVSNYLDEKTVRHTLTEVSRVAAKGSIIACDLYSSKFVRKFGKSFSALFKPTGEFFIFGLDMEGGVEQGLEQKIETFLKECNLKLHKIEVLGKPASPYGVLVEAVV